MPPPPHEDVLDRLSRVAQAQRSTLSALARNEGLTPEDAVDCVQEGLCTLLDWVQTGQLEPAADLAPLLATMVRNAARNHRRRHFRSRPHEEIDAHEPVPSPWASQDDLIARAEEQVRLRACVEELCEIQRAVVTLRLLEERPGEDVAQLLGITKGHAAVLLHRAKLSLRACLTSLGPPRRP